MSPQAPYRIRENALRPEAVYSVEAGDLVRRGSGGDERRWPLASLRRMQVINRPNPYGAGIVFLQMDFGGRKLTIGSRSWNGVGRFADQGRDFAAFARTLAREAAAAAPLARFESAGPQAGGILALLAALLGMGVLAMLGLAVSTHAVGLAVDFAARLLFALILLAAIRPWTSGKNGRTFDPDAPPDALLTSRAGGRS